MLVTLKSALPGCESVITITSTDCGDDNARVERDFFRDHSLFEDEHLKL
jgi:hypothetical protein